MENITKNCPVCQESFSTLIEKQTCCSRGCSNTYRARRIKRPSCAACGKTVNRRLSHCGPIVYCDKKCESKNKNKQIIKNCVICDKEFSTMLSQINKKYCSRKCMGVDVKKRNALRSPQYRSFGECAILLLLKKNFPTVDFISNDRKMLNGYEMDIWIPSIKTGIEYNGPHHFKPIYGEDLLKKTKERDLKKREIAASLGIRIIDINALSPISRTTKSKIMDMFKLLCNEIGWVATNFELNWDSVDAEKKSRKPNQVLDVKQPKIYYLKTKDGVTFSVNNLYKWAKENNIDHSGLYKTKHRGFCKGYKLL